MAHYPFALPVSVIIDGRTYTVYGVQYSGSRGWEFNIRQQIQRPHWVKPKHRVCYAPPVEARSVFLRGEHIEYIWGEPLQPSPM